MAATFKLATQQAAMARTSCCARVTRAVRVSKVAGVTVHHSFSLARSAKLGRKALVVEAVKKSVGDLTKADLEGKRVFVRADLNVPLDKQLNITDDTRIRAAVPTLKYLLDNGAIVLLTSHLVGAPKHAHWTQG